MGRHRAWLSGVLVLVVATAVAAQGGGPGGDDKKQEEKVKAALEKFQKEYKEGEKQKDEGMRATALNVLYDLCSDPRVLDALNKVLNTPKEAASVKVRAAMILGAGGNLKAIPMLEKAFAANEKNEAAMEIVRSFGGLQDKSVVNILVRIIKSRVDRFDDDQASGIARCAIDALSHQRYPESIDTLLGFFGAVNKGRGDPITEANRSMTEEAIKTALTTLTGQQITDPAEWKKWWADNKATFKFPE